MALETIPIIPNAQSQEEIWEISINKSASFPLIHCCGFLRTESIQTPCHPGIFRKYQPGSVFLEKGCTVSLRAQFGPLQSDAEDLNPRFLKKGNKGILIRWNIRDSHLGLSLFASQRRLGKVHDLKKESLKLLL